jgi:hypothetical protein
VRVEDILRRVLGSCALVHSKRLAALLLCVRALVEGGRLTVTGLGRALSTRTSQKHAIKRVDRLLSNGRLRKEIPRFCAQIARVAIGSGRRPVICLDWTSIGANRWALVAAAPVTGRAIPLLFEVYSEARLGNRKVQHRFINRLAAILPAGCKPIIVTDAGFSRPFYAKLVEIGWGYVIRVRGTQRRFQWGRLSYRQVLARGTTSAIELEDIEENYHPAFIDLEPSRFILGPKPQAHRRRNSRDPHRRSAAEAWLLVTNLWRHSPEEIVHIYNARMQIEETFRDAKSHRLGWSLEDAMSRRVARLEALLLIAALATFAVVMIGLAAERAHMARHFQANTVRNRRVLSAFTLGRLVLRTPLVDQLAQAWRAYLRPFRTAIPLGLTPRANGSIRETGRPPF